MKLANIWMEVRERASSEDTVAHIAKLAVRVVHEKGAEEDVIWAWARKGAADLRATMTGFVRGTPRAPAEGGQQTLWGQLEAEVAHQALRRYRKAYAGVVSRYPLVVATDDWLASFLASGGSYTGTLLDTLRVGAAPVELVEYWAA